MGYLGFYPLLLWGLLSFPRLRTRAGPGPLLRSMPASLPATTILWHSPAPDASAHDRARGKVVSALTLAYPVGDFILLFGAAT
ncbi:MAG: hypothetical protein U0531_21940 [Dehalococcoidia bacterium]